jgi:hypothetical protein
MTYNRPEHTKRVLEGIKREGFSEFTIYLDKSITDYDFLKQKELHEIFNQINWAKCNLIKRETQMGLAKSIVSAVTDTLKEYDAVIVLEDDCVPKKYFKKYMEKALSTYKDISYIKSINAYTYPCFDTNLVKSDIFTTRRFCPWGWATWRNEWNDFNFNLKEIIGLLNKKKICLKSLGNDVFTYCNDQRFLDLNMDIWSLNWILIHYLKGSKVICPKYSMIDNIGFDGSGIHSKKTNVFQNLKNKKLKKDHFNMPTDEYSLGINENIEKSIINFLEKVSKMTMLIEK